MGGPKPRLFVHLGLAAILSVAVAAQSRDADAVLREMRAALGGDAALDAVKTWSVSGSVDRTFGKTKRNSSLELFAMLPSHFMEVQRSLNSMPGPVRMDIETTDYRGFAGDALIQRTESNVPPPNFGPRTPAEEQRAVQGRKRDFARIIVGLLGKSVGGSPLAFSYLGLETVDGQPTEVVEMRAADGYVMRLHVNQATRLPAEITWQAPAPVFFTTTSTTTAVVRSGQVVSQSPPAFDPPGPPPPTGPDVTWRLVFSDFKTQDGLNWPHRLKEMSGTQVMSDMKLGKFKINPKIDARKFNVGR